MPATNNPDPNANQRDAGGDWFRRITTIVSAIATVCFLVLIGWALADRTLLTQSEQSQRVFWVSIMILGGALPSFILSLFGERANLQVTLKSVAFTVSGGYAVAIFAVFFINSDYFLTAKSENMRIIELVPANPSMAYATSVPPDIDNPAVSAYLLQDPSQHHPRLVFYFPPNVNKVTVTVSSYVGSQLYTGTIEVSKAGVSIERKTYKLAKSE